MGTYFRPPIATVLILALLNSAVPANSAPVTPFLRADQESFGSSALLPLSYISALMNRFISGRILHFVITRLAGRFTANGASQGGALASFNPFAGEIGPISIPVIDAAGIISRANAFVSFGPWRTNGVESPEAVAALDTDSDPNPMAARRPQSFFDKAVVQEAIATARFINGKRYRTILLGGASARWTMALVHAAWKALFPRERMPTVVILSGEENRDFYQSDMSDEARRRLLLNCFAKTWIDDDSAFVKLANRMQRLPGVKSALASTVGRLSFYLAKRGRLLVIDDVFRTGQKFVSWRVHLKYAAGFRGVDFRYFFGQSFSENRPDLYVGRQDFEFTEILHAWNKAEMSPQSRLEQLALWQSMIRGSVLNEWPSGMLMAKPSQKHADERSIAATA